MLSRVADALLWMGRYLERAAFLARDVDVTFHLDLDLHGVLAAPVRADWDRFLPPSPPPGAPPPADGAGATTARWILLGGPIPRA